MWRLMRLPLKTRLRPWLASNGVAFAPRCLRSGLQGQAPSEKLSGHRHVTLHTDAAKVYRCKIPGVLHDEVAHCKKKAKINGKWKWHAPNYVRLVAHKMHGQKAPVHCKAGTGDRSRLAIPEGPTANQSGLPCRNCCLASKAPLGPV